MTWEIACGSVRRRWASLLGAFVALTFGSAIVASSIVTLRATQDFGKAQSVAQMTTALSVIVVVFVLIGIFAFLVDQRSRELALLSLIGASPRRVRAIVRAEAVLVGAVAALVGGLLGVPGSQLFRSWLVSTDIAPRTARPVRSRRARDRILHRDRRRHCRLRSGGLASLPATPAGRPAGQLRIDPRDNPLRWALGVLLLCATVAVVTGIALLNPSGAADPGTYFEVPLMLAGALAILAPVLAQPVARAMTLPFLSFGALPTVLRQSTLQGGRRVAAIVTPAVLAVGMVSGTMSMENAGSEFTAAQSASRFQADYLLSPTAGSTFDRASLRALRGNAGTRVTTVANGVVMLRSPDGKRLNGIDVRAIDLHALGDVLMPRVIEGELRSLLDDALVVGTDVAADSDLQLGETLSVRTTGGPVDLRVMAVVDSVFDHGEAYVPSDVLRSSEPAVALVRAGREGSATPGVSGLHNDDVRIETRSEYLSRAMQDAQRDTRLANVVVLGTAVTFALMALANTLMMNVAARRKELSVLGFAGATRPQVVGLVVGEAVLTVVVGAILGLAAAVLEVAAQRFTLSRVADPPPIALPWSSFGQIVALCAATAVTAAFVAAWRATASASPSEPRQ